MPLDTLPVLSRLFLKYSASLWQYLTQASGLAAEIGRTYTSVKILEETNVFSSTSCSKNRLKTIEALVPPIPNEFMQT